MPCWDHKKASAQSAEAFFVAPRGLPSIRGSAPNTPGILPRRSPPPIPSVHPLAQPWHPTWHAHLEQSLANSTLPFQVVSKCFHLAHLSTLHDRQCP